MLFELCVHGSHVMLARVRTSGHMARRAALEKE